MLAPKYQQQIRKHQYANQRKNKKLNPKSYFNVVFQCYHKESLLSVFFSFNFSPHWQNVMHRRVKEHKDFPFSLKHRTCNFASSHYIKKERYSF